MQQANSGVRLEPVLKAISEFLDAQADLIECIRRDLMRGLKRPGSGRNGLTPSQILRSMVLMRVVCHERSRSIRLRVTVREMKAGPSGSAIRSLIPSHRELLRSKAVVASVAETSGQ